MNIDIYTKENCPNCTTAKQLLHSKQLRYQEWAFEDPANREAFANICPDIRQMPQIFINDQRVGGLAGLQAALNQMELL